MNDFKRLSEEFLREVLEAENIAICSHVNPDGDNLGSIMAMHNYLKTLGKNSYVICNDPVPYEERFLPSIDEVVDSKDLDDIDIDLFIVFDCGDLDRIKRAKNIFEKAKRTVNIDHHQTNIGFADLNILNGNSPATCEILFEIFEILNIKLNKDIATCLFTGISTDTGSFKYDSTTKRTFEIASKLMEYDLDLNEISVNLYQSRSVTKTDLLINTLNTLEYACDKMIAAVTIPEKLYNDLGCKQGDADGIVEFIRDIEPVEIAILLKEKDDYVRLSLRSKKLVDCTKIAQKFNGGGHIRASGGTIYDKSMQDAKEDVLAVAKEVLNEVWNTSN